MIEKKAKEIKFKNNKLKALKKLGKKGADTAVGTVKKGAQAVEKSTKVAKKTVGTGLTAAGVENDLDDTSEDENDTNTNDPK